MNSGRLVPRPVRTKEELSNTDLVAVVKQRYRDAFAVRWNRHHAISRLFARRVVRNEADAQKTAHDAWLNAWRHASHLDGEARFSPSLIAIVRNLILLKLRSRRLRHVVSIEPESLIQGTAPCQYLDEPGIPEKAFEQSARRKLVRDQIASIRRSDRDCVVTALNLTEYPLKGRLRRDKAGSHHRIRNQMGCNSGATGFSDSPYVPLVSASLSENLGRKEIAA